MISKTGWIVLCLHVPLIAWVLINRFTVLNRLADKYLQPLLPGALGTGKAWTTWVHHALIALVVTAYVTVWGLILPGDSWITGARIGSAIALALYTVRETYNWNYHARAGTPDKWGWWDGWAVDGIMDTAGPLLIHLLTWL